MTELEELKAACDAAWAAYAAEDAAYADAADYWVKKYEALENDNE